MRFTLQPLGADCSEAGRSSGCFARYLDSYGAGLCYEIGLLTGHPMVFYRIATSATSERRRRVIPSVAG